MIKSIDFQIYIILRENGHKFILKMFEHMLSKFPFLSFQLKEKKKSLKGNLKSMRDENLDLQLQIDKLASELKEQALLFAHDKANALQQKQKKDHLKDKLKGMRDENSDLKLQIEQLNSRLQKQTLSTKHDDMNACFNMVSNSMDGVLKTLQNRITTQFSTDGVSNSYFFCIFN